MTIRDIVLLVRRLWWVLVGFIVLGLIGGGAAAALTAPTYQSTAHLLVATPNIDTGSLVPPEGIPTPQRAVNYANMVTTTAMAQRVIDKLGLHEPPARLLSQVNATVMINSTIIEITAVDTDPAQAQRIAQGFVTELVSTVPKVDTQSGPVEALTVTDPANLPEFRHSAGTTSILALGVLAGIVVGGAAIWLLQFVDDRVRRAEDLTVLAGAPMLAVAQRVPGSRRGSYPAPASGALAEPFRAVRTAVQFAASAASATSTAGPTGGPGGERPVVAVTGAATGVAAVSANLAAVHAETGVRVLLVGADRTGGGLDTLPGLGAGPAGLPEVLVGTAALHDAVRPWGDTGVDVLPADPADAPALTRAAWTDLVTAARGVYDVIVVCCPPIDTVSDAAIIAAEADATVLVARWGVTRLEDLGAARARLETVRARLVGTVLTDVPRYAATAARRSTVNPAALALP